MSVVDITEQIAGKHAAADFELVWSRLKEMSFTSLKEAHRYSYMAGRGAQQFSDLSHRLLNTSLDSCGGEEQTDSSQ